MRERTGLEHELNQLGLERAREVANGYSRAPEIERETLEEQARCKERLETFRKGLAQPVREALDARKWEDAVRLAILHNGIRDKYNLANMIYLEQHGPARGYCKIKKGDQVSIKNYNDILYNLVIPRIKNITGRQLPQELVVTADVLNIRASPSLQGNIIGSLRKGQIVSWLESSNDGQWYKVRKDNLTGWSFHKYMTAKSTQQQEPNTANTTRGGAGVLLADTSSSNKSSPIPPPAAPVQPALPPRTPGGRPSFVPAVEWDQETWKKYIQQHQLFDALYADERNTAISRELHPLNRFWNIFTWFKPFTFGSQIYENAIALSGQQDFPNPLIDASLALPEKPVSKKPVFADEDDQKKFDAISKYRIFVPTRLSDDFNSFWSFAEKPKAKISLFFGVELEINSFGLRKFFDNTSSVLITIPSIYAARGIGITTQMIRQLLDASGLKGIDFSVEVMAGYSGGYRGLNGTIINNIVELKNLKRLIYLDAFYNHDDTPLPKSSHPFYKKNTLWAIETALSKSPNAELFIYGYTMSGTPRLTKFKKGAPPPPPSVPIDAFLKKRFPSRVKHFIDLEYDPRIVDELGNNKLESICLARLIQSGIDESFQREEIALLVRGKDDEREQIAKNILALVDLLPERGSLGTWGRSGFIDLFKWVTASPQKDAISQFPADKAFELVWEFKLLGRWTRRTKLEKPSVVKTLMANNVPTLIWPRYWLRHVDFVQEISKECLLP
jgi:hypothetical protein